MATTRLGLEAVLYRNSGTYNVPVLVPLDNAKDVTLNMEKGNADISSRGGGSWKAVVGVLKDASVDFTLIWNTSDANFTAIKNAFLAADVAGSTIEFFVM